MHTTWTPEISTRPEATPERGARAVRSVAAFPDQRVSESRAPARLIAEALATLPTGASLDITFRGCGDPGGLRATVGLCAEIETGRAERLVDHLAMMIAPGARLATAISSQRPPAHIRPVHPCAVTLDTGETAKIHLIRGPSSEQLMPAVAASRHWRFDLEAALRALGAHSGAELRLRVAAVPVDARMRRGLDQLKQRLGLLAARGAGQEETRENLWSLANALLAEDHCLSIRVELSFVDSPDELALDLVSLALFGVRADRCVLPEGQLDLRHLWPARGELPPLLPSLNSRLPINSGGAGQRGEALPAELVLGLNSGDALVRLTGSDRARHLYVVGGTGAGKSTLLLNLMAQDICNGEGMILFDPHGDLADDVRALVPAERRQDLVFADAADPDGGFGLNMLAGYGPDAEQRRNYTANSLIQLFSRVLYDGLPEAFGPMFEIYFRNALLLLLEARGGDASLLDFDAIFQDPGLRGRLVSQCRDRKVVEFWTSLVANVTHDEITLNNIAPYITCKLAQVTGNPTMRRLLCRQEGNIDLRQAMDAGRIVILKAPSGLIGRSDVELLAAVTVSQIAGAAMSRADVSRASRRPCRVYIDEFQNCAGPALSSLLAEARKFGISLVLANQSLSQVDGGRHRPATGDAALANAANLVAFRVGAPDAARLAPWFAPDISGQELCRLPDFHAAVRCLDQGRPTEPQILRMAPPPS